MADQSTDPQKKSDAEQRAEEKNASKKKNASGQRAAGVRGTSKTSPGSFEGNQREVDESIDRLRRELDALDQPGDMLGRAETWIAENPMLAVFLAAGAGLLTGRLLSAVRASFAPAPLPVRARRQVEQAGHDVSQRTRKAAQQAAEGAERAREGAARGAAALGTAAAEGAREASHWAQETGTEAAKRARKAGSEASKRAQAFSKDASHKAREAGTKASERARAWSDEAARKTRPYAEQTRARAREAGTRAKAAGAVAAEQARRVSAEARQRAGDAERTVRDTDVGKAVEEAAKDLSEATKKKARHGRDLLTIVRNAARTALAAAIIKKVSDVVRRVT